MFSDIEIYLYMLSSGSLAVIFYLLANLTGVEYDSPLTGHHRPKKVLSTVFIVLMVPCGIFGLLFVIPYALVSRACGYCRSYYRRKDLKFSFELGQLSSKPCYRQLTFAAQNGSQEAARALEMLSERRRELEAQRTAALNDTERERSLSRSLYNLEHSHDWDDLPYEISQVFDISQWVAKKRDELGF